MLVRITMNSSYANLYGKHRTEWVPTKTHRLITDVDATLEQQVLDLAQRYGIPNITHHRQADHFGWTVGMRGFF